MLARRVTRLVVASGFLVAIATFAAHARGPSAGASANAKRPVLRLNVYFAAGFEDSAYQQAAFDKVLKSWKPAPPVPPPGSKTVVIVTIARDGTLLDAYFNLKTGNKAWDEAALQAVKKAGALPPLPPSYRQPTLEAHFHFEVD